MKILNNSLKHLFSKKINSIFFIIATLFTTFSCSDYGTMLEFNGGELYYTQQVEYDEANNLGKYLIREGFFDGEKRTVQITRENQIYQFRIVVSQDAVNDNAYNEALLVFINEISRNVFDGAMVEIHLCDSLMNTLKIVHFTRQTNYGEKLMINGSELFFQEPISRENAELLGKFLVSQKIFAAEKVSAQIRYENQIYELHIVIKNGIETDENYAEFFTDLAKSVSDSVFRGNTVSIYLCDEFFKTVKIIEQKN